MGRADLLHGGGPVTWYTWTVQISVADTWVADGFDLTADRLKDMVLSDLGYAHDGEVVTKIIRAPKPEDIRKEQGYES